MKILIGVLIPFIGTSIGASLVYLMKDKINETLEKILLGFASGVMIAASVWSLLIPAIERSEELGTLPWLPPAIGFILGILSLIYIDRLTKKMNSDASLIENKMKKTKMLFLAVTIHNVPEGMAVGVIFAGFLAGAPGITLAGAFALAIGIAIQNFPEGAIISMPLKNAGLSKNKSFFWGVISGVVEPLASGLTIALTSLVVPVLPYLLAYAAGAMIYVVVHELIPDAQKESNNFGPLGVAIGFTIMMILDVALG
ncbi:MAG: ZIP family metal transporter [Bacilli bacterium]|nr:ZIP family metal transporter [Bacilli bacterium]